MIVSYRITSGQEHIVLEMLANKIAKDKTGIYAILIFPDVKGYIFAELKDMMTARHLAQGIPPVKGILRKEVDINQIMTLAEEKREIIKVGKGDVVEFVSGPFRGERAKVIRVVETKDTITVELTEVAVPVPVTAKINSVKIIQKAEED